MRSRAILSLVFGALLLVPASGWAQEEESAVPLGSSAPSASAVPSGPAPPGDERRDLYLDMPYYLGGFEPDIVMTRGEDHFARLPAGDPTRIELETLLAAVGADIEDMTSGYALVSQDDFFSFVVAIRIAGVELGTLLPAYLPTLMDDLIEPTSVAESVVGKDVLVIPSVGEDGELVDLYVYDEGDTVWMMQGPRDVIEITLDNLPDPVGS